MHLLVPNHITISHCHLIFRKCLSLAARPAKPVPKLANNRPGPGRAGGYLPGRGDLLGYLPGAPDGRPLPPYTTLQPGPRGGVPSAGRASDPSKQSRRAARPADRPAPNSSTRAGLGSAQRGTGGGERTHTLCVRNVCICMCACEACACKCACFFMVKFTIEVHFFLPKSERYDYFTPQLTLFL